MRKALLLALAACSSTGDKPGARSSETVDFAAGRDQDIYNTGMERSFELEQAADWVRIARISADGALSRSKASRALGERTPDLVPCYEAESTKTPNFMSVAKVVIEVSASGEGRLVQLDAEPPSLGACASEVLKAMRFPAALGPTRVEAIFDFSEFPERMRAVERSDFAAGLEYDVYGSGLEAELELGRATEWVRVGNTKADGALSRGSASRALNALTPDLVPCYEAENSKTPNFMSTAAVVIDVSASGEGRLVRIEAEPPSLAACASEVLRTVPFPAAAGPTRVEALFDFSKFGVRERRGESLWRRE